jgi:hypothetical protein
MSRDYSEEPLKKYGITRGVYFGLLKLYLRSQACVIYRLQRSTYMLASFRALLKYTQCKVDVAFNFDHVVRSGCSTPFLLEHLELWKLSMSRNGGMMLTGK